jgi:isopentenyl-diphosphate delta-isomerase type 1
MEWFEIVDDQDRIIGQAPRSECHGNPSLIHRVAHVHVFNRQGELLLQKRSPGKDIQPGKWDTSVGGHLDIGESYLQAARRELWEELGIEQRSLTFMYYSKIRNAVESENVASFMVIAEGPFRFCRNEIDEVRFWSAAAIDNCLGGQVFTPNFEEEWGLLMDWCRKYPAATTLLLALGAGESLPNLSSSLKG